MRQIILFLALQADREVNRNGQVSSWKLVLMLELRMMYTVPIRLIKLFWYILNIRFPRFSRSDETRGHHGQN